MPHRSALQPTPRDANRTKLAGLEERVAARERELEAFKVELQELQARYLSEVGGLYERLHELEAAIAELEIRAGIRPPPLDLDDAEVEAGEPAADGESWGAGCSNRSAPSDDLRRVFRDVAKAIHPDRALDDAARYRRHSLMAEANRAYAERDGDRLRLILHAWQQSAASLPAADPDEERRRVHRRVADLEAHLILIDAEFAELRDSAINGLKRKIDDARSRGWDLFAEIVSHVKREVGKQTARLATLQRNAARS